jgi:hypothetical protein
MYKWFDAAKQLNIGDKLYIPAVTRADAQVRAIKLKKLVDKNPLDSNEAIVVLPRHRDRRWWIMAYKVAVADNTAFIKRSDGKLEKVTIEPPADVCRMFRLMRKEGTSYLQAFTAAKNGSEQEFVRRLYGEDTEEF